MREGLCLRDLHVMRAGQPLVSLSAEIAPGEVLCLMGPSGAGKSTALAAILGALPRDFIGSGQVLLDGRDVSALPPHLRRIGLLFQDDILFPHLSVAQNLAFALPPERRGRALRSAAVEAALEEAGLSGFGPRDPATLSGGQRARVALMRALLAEPRAILLDEPFSRLDAERRAQMRRFVLDTITARAIPALLVTHDREDALATGGRVLTPMGVPVSP
ncbi:MAG: ATP-binding cassette domain-containing protein [Cypionkella sp.]|nr:ATP-binding cassette domain-containing protein [Cypionkella sp.]